MLDTLFDFRHQNEHNMLLHFLQCLTIILLQTSKTDNNALDIDAIYNLKLRKTLPSLINVNSGENFVSSKALTFFFSAFNE
jgi:hypothetical protein